MTPERRKLLNECLAPGESELYHTTATSFTGSKEDIAWLKAFRVGELKKRTAYQRRHLIEDARMQIEKWEAKAKREAETLVECPGCGTPGFTPRGLKSHRCKGVNRSITTAKPRKPKAIDGKAEVVADLDLSAIRSALEAERDTVIKHEEEFKDATLPRFLRMGLQCVKAREVFAIDDHASRNKSGKNQHSKEALSPGDKASEEPAEPTSFSDWLSRDVPWLNKASAYKYLRAVEGLGLDHKSNEKQLDKALAAARKQLADGKKLTLTLLANKAGKVEVETETEDPNTPESRAAESREQVHAWINAWDQKVKAGNLEDADLPTLKSLDEFLANTRDHVRRRIKSAAK